MVPVTNQKRQRFDPLATSSAPRSLVRVDLFRTVIDVQELPPGADLRRAPADGIEFLHRAGWTIEGVSYSGTFVRRGNERHYLSIVPPIPGFLLARCGVFARPPRDLEIGRHL